MSSLTGTDIYWHAAHLLEAFLSDLGAHRDLLGALLLVNVQKYSGLLFAEGAIFALNGGSRESGRG